MEIAKTATKNVLYLTVADIITRIVGFFYVVFTARYLSLNDYGMLSFGLAFVEICGIGLDLGLSIILVRETAKNESKMNFYFNNILFIKIILCSVTSLVLGIILFFTNYGYVQNLIIILLFVNAIINSFVLVLVSIFQAFNKMQFIAIGRIAGSFIMFFGVLLLIRLRSSVIQWANLYLISAILVFILSLLLFLIYFKPKLFFSYNKKIWLELVRLSLPFAVSIIFVTIYYRIDSVMLKFFRSNADVALYNAAYNLVFALCFISGIIIVAVFPIMSKLFVESKEKLILLYEISFKLLALFAFPVAVGTMLLADKIILLIYGDKFFGSVNLLKILIWSLVFMFLNVSIANLFNVINKQKIVACLIIAAAMFNILLNLFLIPRFGAAGASIATVVSEFIVFVLILVLSHRYGYFLSKSVFLNLLKIVVCAFLMGVLVFFTKQFNLFLVVFFGIIFYFVAILVFRVMDKSNIKLFINLILKK